METSVQKDSGEQQYENIEINDKIPPSGYNDSIFIHHQEIHQKTHQNILPLVLERGEGG